MMHYPNNSCFNCAMLYVLGITEQSQEAVLDNSAAVALNTGYIPLLTFQLPYCWCWNS